MAAIETIRIKDIPTTATTAAADDYIVIDGATNKVRKGLASNLITATAAAAVAGHDADAAAHSEVFSRALARVRRGSSTGTILFVADSQQVGATNPANLFAGLVADSAPGFNVRIRNFNSPADGGNNTWGEITSLYQHPDGGTRIDCLGVAPSGWDNHPCWPATGAFGVNGWYVDYRLKLAAGVLTGAKRGGVIGWRGEADLSYRQLEIFIEADTGQLVVKTNTGDTDTLTDSTYFGSLAATGIEGKICTLRLVYTGDTEKILRTYLSIEGAEFAQFGWDNPVAAPSATANHKWFIGGMSLNANITASFYGVELWQYPAPDTSQVKQLVIPDSIGNWRSYRDATTGVDPNNWHYAGPSTLDIIVGARGGYHLGHFIDKDMSGYIPPRYWNNPFVDVVFYGAQLNYNLLAGNAALGGLKDIIDAFETYALAACPGAALASFTEMPLGDYVGAVTLSTNQIKMSYGAGYSRKIGTPVLDTHRAMQRRFTQAEISAMTADGTGVHYAAGSAGPDYVAGIFASALTAGL